VESGRVERALPVDFAYPEQALATYDAARAAHLAHRDDALASLDAAEASYSAEYGAARSDYDEAASFWQRARDAVRPPDHQVAYDAFLADARAAREVMSTDPPDAAALRRDAAARTEAREVTLYAATVRFTVRDASTGRVLTLLTLRGEDLSPDALPERLAAAAADALEAR